MYGQPLKRQINNTLGLCVLNLWLSNHFSQPEFLIFKQMATLKSVPMQMSFSLNYHALNMPETVSVSKMCVLDFHESSMSSFISIILFMFWWLDAPLKRHVVLHEGQYCQCNQIIFIYPALIVRLAPCGEIKSFLPFQTCSNYAPMNYL